MAVKELKYGECPTHRWAGSLAICFGDSISGDLWIWPEHVAKMIAYCDLYGHFANIKIKAFPGSDTIEITAKAGVGFTGYYTMHGPRACLVWPRDYGHKRIIRELIHGCN